MSRDLDITLLFATHNRSAILRETLEHLAKVERDGLTVEIVVVDNNSADDTRAVVESFAERLPVRYLFEPKPGKNCALNRGLSDAEFGRLVVFTDDDITPRPDWFRAIHATAARWSDYDIFGGKIEVVWPVRDVPGWTEVPFIRAFGFASHDYAPQDQPYGETDYPFGPNFWVRRGVLTPDVRFDEKIGPHPTNRILGDEIIFVQRLRAAGHTAMYTPSAVVGHRIQAETVSESGIRRRAWTLGRGAPHVSGLCRQELLARSPFVWRLMRYAALCRHGVAWLLAHLSLSRDRRVERTVTANLNMAYGIESLAMARAAAREREATSDAVGEAPQA